MYRVKCPVTKGVYRYTKHSIESEKTDFINDKKIKKNVTLKDFECIQASFMRLRSSTD